MGLSLSPPVMLMLLGGGILLWSGIEDARVRTISNAKNAALALLAPAWWWANGLAVWPDMAWQLAGGVAVFLPFVALFAAGWMGGGDVKMLGALGLWLPLGAFAQLLVWMSLIGGAITVLLMLEARWRRTEGALEIPYGVAIAAAAIPLLPATVS